MWVIALVNQEYRRRFAFDTDCFAKIPDMRHGLDVVAAAKLCYVNQPDQPRVDQGVPEGGQWTNYDSPDQIVGNVPPLAAADGTEIEVPVWSDSDDTEIDPPTTEEPEIEVPVWSDPDDTETPPATEAPTESETPPAVGDAESETPPATEAPTESETPPAVGDAGSAPASEQPAKQDSSDGRGGGMLGRLLKRR